MDSHTLLERISRFHGHHQGAITLAPMEKLLSKLGHPEKKCPPVIHVAGTNGKGSVTAFLKSCLEHAGLRVHRFTSPHLFSYTERIEIYGVPIESGKLEHYLDVCAELLPVLDISLFEALTASAFLAFSEHTADMVIMEVGLGGIWDATNCVTTTCVSVVTSVSKDHVHILGPELTDIARNKAGIMRPKVPCVISPQSPEVMDVFLHEAAQKETPLFLYERDWEVTIGHHGFVLTHGEESFQYPLPGLLGEHQIFNGATAIMALKKQNVHPMAEEHLCAGVRNVVWAGRLERLSSGVLTRRFPGWELWIDGAHNEGGASALGKYALDHWQKDPKKEPLIIVLSIGKKKDSEEVMKILSPVAQVLCFIDAPDPRHAFIPEEVLEQQAEDLEVSCPLFSYATIEDFLSRAPMELPDFPFCRILFCGSLYSIAAVRHYNTYGTPV